MCRLQEGLHRKMYTHSILLPLEHKALAEIDNIETMRIYKILYPLRVRVELMNIKQWRFSYIFVISF